MQNNMSGFVPGRGRGRGVGRGIGRGDPAVISNGRGNFIPNGRGRGSVNGNNHSTNTPWAMKSNNAIPNGQTKLQSQNGDDRNDEHVAMREKMVVMASKYLNVEDEESSSDEEIYDDEIISNTVKKYNSNLDADEERKEHQMLLDVLQSGAIACLICIDNVKRLDAIWNCAKCACILHLQCIQKWAREGVGKHTINHDGDIKELDLTWQCPKCRHDYKQTECPTKYYCFCGKVENPRFDPWIVPHSCGQECKKMLIPNCGHECLLLCHPGACPPCPITVNTKCHCGRKGPLLKRCSNKKWSCGKPCGRRLSCMHHDCEEFCHDGECPPCPYTSQQPCLCGKNVSERPCAQPSWSCENACSKPYSCGHHLCEQKCHLGDCGECPRSGKRHCPCGKTLSAQPCTEDVPTCEDTCLLPLGCGIHKCVKRCHYGPCDTCLQVVDKTCRCGRRNKKVPCSQLFTCDFKCTKMRNCGRHPCKKKCCDGNCPPCEQVCNRNLNCRNHKCPSPCHQGLCYPCTLSTQLTCFCGAAKMSVACGKEKVTKPPRCKLSCKIPPDCHHVRRIPHRCHYNRCPPCTQKCIIRYATCEHECAQKCHDRVFDQKAKELDMLRNSSKKVNDSIYFVSIPCPPCSEPIEMLCFGQHVKRYIPCSELKPYSCGDICGRLLPCTNHVCQRECHVVKGNPEEGQAGKNCSRCDEMCMKPRTEGCIHDCHLSCHPGDCPECTKHLKMECHCKSIQMFIKCCEFTSADEVMKESLLNCKSRCTKTLLCGHLCPKTCHSDNCVSVEDCSETKKIKCPCGRRRKEVSCVEDREGKAKVDCDERCKEIKEKKQKEKNEKEESEKAAEEKKHAEEVEKFERKRQGRKRKQRKVTETEEEISFFKKYLKWILVAFIVLVIGIAVHFLLE